MMDNVCDYDFVPIAGVHPRPATDLFSLRPEGLGNGLAESITSYITRLARAHSVKVWALVKNMIAPRLIADGVEVRNRMSDLVNHVGRSLNGNSLTALRVLHVLQECTGRGDLHSSTMVFAAEFISGRGLLRPHQAWCPHCLREWEYSGREVYFPLLWNLAVCAVCPIHQTLMVTECPHCDRTFLPLMPRSKPELCPRCGQRLAHKTAAPPPRPHETHREGEILPGLTRSQCAMEFLETGPLVLSSLKPSRFPENIAFMLKTRNSGNVSALARDLGCTQATVRAWMAGTQKPTLPSLIEIVNRLGCSVCDPLARPLSELDLRERTSPKTKTPSPKKPLNLERMKRVMQGVVAASSYESVSLRSIAEELGCHQTTLVRHFPELAAEIKERYGRFVDIRKEVRSQLIGQMVEHAVREVHKSGEVPTAHRVGEGLPGFCSLRDPVAHRCWKEQLARLGYRLD